MNSVIKTFQLKNNLELRIYQDECVLNPREEWDNTTKMYCFHRSYTIGDNHNYNKNDFSSFEEFKNQLLVDYDIAIIKPVYMYDHSGQSISIKPFSCRFDSGQVGWIFIEKKDSEGLFEEQLQKIIDSDIAVYNQYLSGDTYGFTLVEKSTCKECQTVHENIIDSCWNFYGYDIKKNGILEYLPADISDEILEQL
jgi:hypothetical protein